MLVVRDDNNLLYKKNINPVSSKTIDTKHFQYLMNESL